MTKIHYPLISILIPYYNHNRYVASTLNSILEDPYPNKEIVVINDGSTESDSSDLLNWIDNNSHKMKIIYNKYTKFFHQLMIKLPLTFDKI